jgi:hypothetical protein
LSLVTRSSAGQLANVFVTHTGEPAVTHQHNGSVDNVSVNADSVTGSQQNAIIDIEVR